MSLALKDDFTIFPFWLAPQVHLNDRPLTSCNLLSSEINL